MSGQQWAHVVAGESDDWRETAELLEDESTNVGVLSLSNSTEVLNGTMKQLGAHEFHMGDIDAVRGNYLVFPEYMVDGVDEKVGAQTLGPEDVNDSNFYVGHSRGVPWFELKLEEDYSIPDRETPHVHNAWEFYSFHDGEGVLDVAGENYDFTDQEHELWSYRDEVSQVNMGEGEVLGVPPGVPHKVNQQDQNPHLVVARYAEDGDVGRYDLGGQRIDPWSETGNEIDMRTYPEALE